jgi:hypothetical protein
MRAERVAPNGKAAIAEAVNGKAVAIGAVKDVVVGNTGTWVD